MKRLKQSMLILSVLLFGQLTFPVHAAKVAVISDEVAVGFDYPWALVQLPEPKAGWLVTERTGQLIHVADDGTKVQVPLQLPGLYVAGQSGLFDVTLAPDFATSRWLYLSYACGTPNANTTCLARTRLSKTTPYRTQATEKLFTARPLRKGAAHYGGRMAWLPDQTLLLTLGDGFDYREQAQNLENHFGKVVRLTMTGEAPADNPFPDKTDGRIFSYGHRNSQGIVYDPTRKVIWQHEHGPRGGDELNRLQAGRNYGWPIVSLGIDYTGAMVTPYEALPGVVDPEYHWTPSLAPADMALYQGAMFPQWQGGLLITHLAGKRLQVLMPKHDTWQVAAEYRTSNEARLRAVAVADDGAIWLLTDSDNGRLIRLSAPKD
ncbi:PQQ-dependent sugar dehydrogenase [Pseudidiomarina sediminum]|uniref:PQQ-dependent sugar dehydrogenase n=1 Tax=Pseudidiomarina sediminum TaxID=431675 RepID=UPI001C97A51C|nr:PQQ-dependent sugar dehydrogenase [Pseudidiomarina sediminum]